MDMLRQSFTVPLPDGTVEQYQLSGEQPFARLTCSVMLGTERQRKRWTHTLGKLSLRATAVDVVGDLHSLSVTGHRDALAMLVSYPSIHRVQYAEHGLPNFGNRSAATDACPVPREVREKRNVKKRAAAEQSSAFHDGKAIAQKLK